jgi:hypothetical protein
MATQLRGPFEKFVDSPYSKKRPSPYLYAFVVAPSSYKGLFWNDRNSNSNDG